MIIIMRAAANTAGDHPHTLSTSRNTRIHHQVDRPWRLHKNHFVKQTEQKYAVFQCNNKKALEKLKRETTLNAWKWQRNAIKDIATTTTECESRA